MIDPRAVIGTSFVHAALAAVLAGVFAPFPIIICADCGGGWWFPEPDPIAAFELGSRINVYPIDAVPTPVVASGSPMAVVLRRPCAGQDPVDRLPQLIDARLPSATDVGNLTACVHITATGRPDAIRVVSRSSRQATVVLRRLIPTWTFMPAYRNERPVDSWVEVQAVR
ncbi:hypothetical protein FHT00_001239 [Sphingomonas insulae]|uniref:TonB C-terminal domain-containing protein n=1 Tax=Sphingomonas insulae TaxID=424800 RepID=A0ABN1HQT1_9SPHN|nr:hypothetical protein [Sphingomonas insulae]NIJ29306.1 hypothetical protein [Sphingomonas insulae]